jgi:energy-coupling factor transport system ATP-binding protein
VAYVPQNPERLLFAETVAEELAFSRRGHGLPPDPAADLALLARLGLDHCRDSHPRDLSVGEKQRLALAAVLVPDPELILLDEPTRGLDYVQKYTLAGLLHELRRAGKTVIMATHDVELAAATADRVVLMAEGQIVVDGPARRVMAESLVFASQVNKLFRDPRLLTPEDVLAGLGEGRR